LQSILLAYSSDSIIRNNLIKDNFYGIGLVYSKSNMVENNNVNSNNFGLIFLLSESNKVTHNDITNNFIGIVDGSPEPLNSLETDEIESKDYFEEYEFYNKVKCNVIAGNEYGVINEHYYDYDTSYSDHTTKNLESYDSIIDARYNWWGDATGPGSVEDEEVMDPETGKKAEGDGDVISKGVLFDPWLKGPHAEISLCGEKGENNWYISEVDVSFTPQSMECEAEVDIIEYSFDRDEWHEYYDPLEIDEEGETTIYYRAKDVDGNIGIEKDHRIKIDRTAPSNSTISLSEEKWTNNDYVTVTINPGEDELSGVDRTEYRTKLENEAWSDWLEYDEQLNITEEGKTKVEARTIDNAGNISECDEGIVKIDRTAPRFKIGDDTYYGDEEIYLGYIATNYDKQIEYAKKDDESGFNPEGETTIETYEEIPTDTAGFELEHDVTVEDRAGNETTITFIYNVISLDDLAELLEPVNEEDNRFRGNRTVPIKLQVYNEDGGAEPISAPGLTFELKLFSEEEDDYLDVSSTREQGDLDDAEFRLSEDDDQYIFNLNLRGLDQGEYELEIHIKNGTGIIGTIELEIW